MSEKSRQNIGLIVRTFRKQQGLTEEQLATKAGVSRQVLRNVESGKANVTLSTLDKLGEALGVELY